MPIGLVYKEDVYRWIKILLFIQQSSLKFMSGNTWWSTNVGTKRIPDLVTFSIIFSDIPLDFHELIRTATLKI